MQAMTARRNMILSQLTPEQISFNALIDVFENGVKPMKDLDARLGIKMQDARLPFELSRSWSSVQARLKKDNRFMLLFAPDSVRR